MPTIEAILIIAAITVLITTSIAWHRSDKQYNKEMNRLNRWSLINGQ